jgi:hypothetical protein
MPPQEAINLGAAHGALLQGTRGDTSTLTFDLSPRSWPM